jgi:hypothetical protein
MPSLRLGLVDGLTAELRSPPANSKVSSSINHHSALSWMQWLANKSKTTTTASMTADTTVATATAPSAVATVSVSSEDDKEYTATADWQKSATVELPKFPYPGTEIHTTAVDF